MIRSFYARLIRQSGRKLNFSKLAIRAGISVLILSALFWVLPIDALLGAFGTITPSTWVLVVIGFLLGHIFSAFKWKLLLRAVNVQINSTEAIQAHGAGLFANLCLPSIIGGDVVRAGVVIRGRKQTELIAMGSLADRVNDSFALLLLAGFAALLIPETSDIAVKSIFIGIALVLISGVLFGFAFIRWFPVAKLPEKLERIVLRFRESLESLLRSPKIAVMAFLMSIGIQSGFVLLNLLLARDIGIEASVSLWFFAWPMAKLIALAPISLGGIGVREVAIAGLMAPFGISSAQVVAQSLSWEVVLVGSGLFAGLVAATLPARYTGYKELEGEKL